jgi:MerR family transcriptional regulator, copper efflux regulator
MKLKKQDHCDLIESKNKKNTCMNIGEAANISGINAKMIRHYESIGLLSKAKRSDSGYRVYDHSDVQILRFVKHARELGFPMKEIKKLLSLWKNRKRASSDVKQLAIAHMENLDKKIGELKSMKNALEHLVRHCHGNEFPNCPILDGISENK